MPTFPDNSARHPDQGMTPADMLAVMRVAARRDEVIMFRDTGCWSRPYIALGHPTKPFHVKGKSSDWGPHAGLVPYDSEFSKAFDPAAIKKGFALNKEAIAGKYARPIRASVAESFIRAELLVKKGSAGRPPIDRMTQPRDGVLYFFCTKPNDKPSLPGKPYMLLGNKGPDGRYLLSTFPLDTPGTPENKLFLRESSATPMLAMTVPGAVIPITGDYDLFAVCPSWANYGAMDRKMDPTLDDPLLKKSMMATAGKLASPDAAVASRAAASQAAVKAAFTPEDPDRGNLTPRLVAVIAALVGDMGGKFPRVHHNAESGRPFAPGAEDGFPLTTFHPRRGIGGYSFLNATIDSASDLREYFTRLYAGGYFPPRNRAWQMRSLRDDSAIVGALLRMKSPGRNAS